MEKVDREPCPWRIVDDAGGAFVFGLAGGTVWHFVGGLRNAPSGSWKLKGQEAIARVRARVPVLGGSFAVWGVLFSCCDCTFTYYRRKEDPWNAIMSGAATGGILAARAGIKAAGKSALVGGVILAAIEGLNILVMRVIMPALEKQQMDEAGMVDKLLPPEDPLKPRRVTRKKPVFEETVRPPLSPIFPSGGFGDSSLGSSGLGGGDSSAGSFGMGAGTSQWDTPGFRPDPAMSSSSAAATETKSKGWFW